MLSRLIYASAAGDSMSPGVLAGILAAARRHNPRHDLTGLLAYSSRYFLQAIEGDRAEISALYTRIVNFVPAPIGLGPRA